MAMNGDGMASEIIAAINLLTPTQKGDSAEVWKKVCSAIVLHIQNNADVETELTAPNPTNIINMEVYVAGVGSNGGALVAAPYPVAGTVVGPKKSVGGIL